MKRYRLHTTGAGDGRALTVDFPYDSWQAAYKAAREYSEEHGQCAVQSDHSYGPRGNKRLEVLRIFKYGRALGMPRNP